jgi:hypothetical protein
MAKKVVSLTKKKKKKNEKKKKNSNFNFRHVTSFVTTRIHFALIGSLVA